MVVPLVNVLGTARSVAQLEAPKVIIAAALMVIASLFILIDMLQKRNRNIQGRRVTNSG
jgi:hypothetical protein